MMTLVHQFEGTLPDDRAKLYEKCLDLLLNTWQEQKYMDLGVENPLEERDLRYEDQLKMLADVAFYIQVKNREAQEDTRGLIEEEELAQVLFKARYNEKRMTEENARKDVRVFLDYIRERSGLLVEKGRNEKGENVFAFVHLSFLEYLCAYRIAEDKSKNQDDHIVTLLGYLEDPAWEEPILLALYLFDRSTGPSFIDAFSTAVFGKLTSAYAINGWFLLGRAVRDNLKFAREDMKRIIREILNIWLERSQEDMALAILKEIDRFSKEGKNILKGVIMEEVKNKPVEKAFEFIFRYKQLYEIDLPLLEALAGNKYYSILGAYLPVYRENESISEFIAKNLEEGQWVTYYNSAADKTNENLEKLVTRPLNLKESKGYIISHWAKLFQAYQYRREFLEIHRLQSGVMSGIEGIRCDFGGYARFTYPLRIFRPLTEDTRPVHISKISNQEFINKDRKTYVPLNEKFLASWLIKILLNIFLNFEKTISAPAQLSGSQRKKLTKGINDISREFSREFSQHLSCGFNRDFIRDISWGLGSNLDRYFSRYFSREFSRYFSRDFIRDFRRDLTLEFSRDFSSDFIRGFNRDFRRKLSQHLSRRLSRDFIRYFIRDIRVFSQDCSDFISRLYHKKYHEVLYWDQLSDKDDRRIYELMTEKLENGAEEFIERFFNSLYKYLFEDKFKLTFDYFGAVIQSFSGKGIAGVTRPGNLLSIANPFICPFAFEVLLTATLAHYSLNMLADLKSRFYGKEIPDDEKIEKAVNDYCERNPFDFYFLTFSWDFYAQVFNEKYLKQVGSETRALALAVFVVSAARVSLTAEVPCEGKEWDKTLAAAQYSENPFVQISLTLYKINNAADSTERQENEALLKQQLANFKADYPEYYRLIGLQ